MLCFGHLHHNFSSRKRKRYADGRALLAMSILLSDRSSPSDVSWVRLRMPLGLLIVGAMPMPNYMAVSTTDGLVINTPLHEELIAVSEIVDQTDRRAKIKLKKKFATQCSPSTIRAQAPNPRWHGLASVSTCVG